MLTSLADTEQTGQNQLQSLPDIVPKTAEKDRKEEQRRSRLLEK